MFSSLISIFRHCLPRSAISDIYIWPVFDCFASISNPARLRKYHTLCLVDKQDETLRRVFPYESK